MSVSVKTNKAALDFFNTEAKPIIKIHPTQEKVPAIVSYANLYYGDIYGQTSDEDLFCLLAQPCAKSEHHHHQGDHHHNYRDPKNGAWTFKKNTEDDLFTHVQCGLADHIKSFNEIDSANAILRSIDVYCLGKQWMYHVGKEKGVILKDFLNKCIINHTTTTSQQTPFVMVELGSYCGYSAILLAKAVRELYPNLDNFHLYSLEKCEKFARIATKMIQLAKLDKYISIIIPYKQSLTKTLRDHTISKINYLLFDHDKNLYLKNLQELEREGFITKGTYVAADNVIISPQLQKYRNYVAKLANNKKKIVSTSLVEQKLEYSESQQDLKDGLELTIYLRDPVEEEKV